MPDGFPVKKAASDAGPQRHLEFEHVPAARHPRYSLDVIHPAARRKSDVFEAGFASTTSIAGSDLTQVNDDLQEFRQKLRKKLVWVKTPPPDGVRHLAKEPLHYRNENILYNVEFPFRAVMNLGLLMGTTKAHLNHPDYFRTLQKKIHAEEERNTKKTERIREKNEFERVRKLLIDGEMSLDYIPPEFKSMVNHPTYRVNRLIHRLNAMDYDRTEVEALKKKIIPVEPYEYNGDKYFKHLHITGEQGWVPRRVREERARRSKSDMKTGTKFPSQKKLVKTLYKRQATEVESVSTIFGESSTKPSDVFEPALEKQQNQQDITSRPPGWIKRESHSTNKQLRKILDVVNADALQQADTDAKKLEKSRKKPAGRGETSKPSLEPVTSFVTLQREFGEAENIDVNQFIPSPTHPIVLKYVDEAEGANQLFGNSAELNRLYEREQLFAEKFVTNLHRKLVQYKD